MPSITVTQAAASQTLGQSSTAVPHTGDTNETILATIAIPANAIGANGHIVVHTQWSRNSAGTGNVTPNIRFGLSGSGTGGTLIASTSLATTNLIGRSRITLINAGATNSQAFMANLNMFTSYGTVNAALSTSAIDTTRATEINLAGQLANVGDTITLLSYLIILYPHA